MAIGGPLKAVTRLIIEVLKQGGTYISDRGIGQTFGGIELLNQNHFP